jgi:hypothetical protein
MSENLGFLTVIDQSPGGLTGGYLVLNRAGRPLEFHCTVPIAPEKIQQILYGDTLQPFLCGERIAQTLIQRSKLPVLSIFTNHAAVLPVQVLVTIPIIYVFAGLTKPETDTTLSDDTAVPPVHEIPEELSQSLKEFGIDNTHLRTRSSCLDIMPQIPPVSGFDTEMWQTVRLGNRLIAVPETAETAREQLTEAVKERARTIDLLEPFARIRLALAEARNAA